MFTSLKSITIISMFTLTALPASAVTPANPDATQAVRNVLEYLHEIHGEYMLAAQHTARGPSTWNEDLQYVQNVTGKSPAILGIDVGIYTRRRSEDYRKGLDSIFNDSVAYWKKGGLVTFTWHWGNPMKEENTYKNTKIEFPILKALQKGTPEHREMMYDLDVTAGLLKRLRDKGVPVLWRPLHEMCGGWFWWGKQGKEPFQALWNFMYSYYTRHHKLNNLIWVYGASNRIKTDWFPGHETVDILGVDIYKLQDMLDKDVFGKLESIADGKPIALTENDLIPHPDTLGQREFLWTWFMPWHTEWLRKNSPEMLREVYHHPLVITLDELPAWQ